MSYDPQPPESPGLFAERPVRSDFGRRPPPRGPSYAMRRRITLAVVAALIFGAALWWFHKASPTQPGDIPTIKAEGPFKQRPQQPGGLDIPHQDVQVYQQLDKAGKNQPSVEHLLPPPELPQVSAQAPSQAPIADIETLAPPPVPVIGPAPNAKPAVTLTHPAVETLTPLKSANVDDILGEKSPPPMVATTVMPHTDNVTTQVPLPAASAMVDAPAPAAATVSSVQKSVAKATGAPETLSALMSPSPAAPIPPAKIAAPVKPTANAPVTTSPKTMEQLLQNIDSESKKEPAGDLSSKIPNDNVTGRGVAVQLSSVPDKAAAEQIMTQLQKQYASVLDGVSLRVVKADLGAKGIFYRIESQPLSNERANALCSALKNRHAGCLLVRP